MSRPQPLPLLYVLNVVKDIKIGEGGEQPRTENEKFMKHTLHTDEIVEQLMSDENAGWSRNGAEALAEWLFTWELDTGTEMEFDRVAIRCDFSEYPSALSAYSEYAAVSDLPNLCEEEALEWLNDHTLTIPFDGGVIIQDF